MSDVRIECDENHVYRVDGRVVPSVHEILHSNGFVDDRWYTDEGKKRGQLVAVATELSDKGTLDEDQLQALGDTYNVDLPAYVSRWRRFRIAWDFKTRDIEQPVYHPTFGYCGTPDRVIEREGKIAVLDIKTGGRADWYALQTAAYAYCCPTFARRFIVYLTPDDWKLVEHTDRTDESTWLGALQIFNWKRSHGIAA
jgi:hypothetical protein